MKYDTLKQLQDAFTTGALTADEDGPVTLMLDNDDTFVYVDSEKVFEMHPDDVLDQALSLLGIPHEHV
jgi:hypothetical protein